jgi:TPR repeat protein
MTTEAAELRNPADGRVIDACLELIEAGRPVSEIIDNAKRLSTTALATDYESAQQPGIAPGTKTLPQSWLLGITTLLILCGAATGIAYLPRSAVEAPAIPVVAAAPIPRVTITPAAAAPSDETEALIDRGSMLFGGGNLSGARALYKRAAEAGNARAAMYLASTYDPSFLKQARFGRTVRGDVEAAAYWYNRARDLRSGEQVGVEPRAGSASRPGERGSGLKAEAQSGG